MKTYVIQYKDPNKKDIARRIILEEGGIITQGYQCYCFYCLEYMVTEEQDARIDKRLKYIGLL